MFVRLRNLGTGMVDWGDGERVKRVSEKVAERSVPEVCGCVRGWEACAKGQSLLWWRIGSSLVLGNGKVQHE